MKGLTAILKEDNWNKCWSRILKRFRRIRIILFYKDLKTIVGLHANEVKDRKLDPFQKRQWRNCPASQKQINDRTHEKQRKRLRSNSKIGPTKSIQARIHRWEVEKIASSSVSKILRPVRKREEDVWGNNQGK